VATTSVNVSHTPPLALLAPDDATWDAFVQFHRHGHLLQLAAWGALKSAFGWQCRRLAVVGPHGLLAGAQLLIRRQYGFAVAYVPRGPLLSGDAAVDDVLLAGLRRSLRGQRAVFLRIEPNLLEGEPAGDELHSFLSLRQWQPVDPFQPRSTIQLDVTKATDGLFASFSKGHRADIRRAERQGVAVRVGETPADLDAFFASMRSTTIRKSDYAIHSRDYYQRAWQLFGAQGSALLLLAEADGESVGACMIFVGARQGLYLYGGSNERGLKKGANHLLQWHALQWAHAQGCTSYDFWGIPDALGRAAIATDAAASEQLEAWGVYRFKQGFSGREVTYTGGWDFVYNPLLYRLYQYREARRAAGGLADAG